MSIGDISEANLILAIEKLKSVVERKGAARVGWAAKEVLKRANFNDTVLRKIANKMCENGEYKYEVYAKDIYVSKDPTYHANKSAKGAYDAFDNYLRNVLPKAAKKQRNHNILTLTISIVAICTTIGIKVYEVIAEKYNKSKIEEAELYKSEPTLAKPIQPFQERSLLDTNFLSVPNQKNP